MRTTILFLFALAISFTGAARMTLAAETGGSCEGSPVSWSTYLGGAAEERGHYVAVGPDGSIFVAAWCSSWDFPRAPKDLGIPPGSGVDIAVVRMSPDGKEYLWSAVLGGAGDELPVGLHVDDRGIVTVSGYATAEFPTTENALQRDFGGGERDAFVARLDPEAGEGGLLYSTFIGGPGDDSAVGVHTDGDGVITVAGYTSWAGLPTTPGAFQETFGGGSFDAFVMRLRPGTEATDLVYSTFLGGGGSEGDADDQIGRRSGWGFSVDGIGDVLLTGHTSSGNFPTTEDAWDRSYHGWYDAFAVRLRPRPDLDPSEQLAYSTYVGGNAYEAGTGIVAEPGGALLFTGWVWSTDFPTTEDAVSRSLGGECDAFLVRIDPSFPPAAQLTYATYLGGGGQEVGDQVLLLDATTALVAGWTMSPNFPLAGAGAGSALRGEADGYFSVFDLGSADAPRGKLKISAIFGGSSGEYNRGAALSRIPGRAIMTGTTYSSDFPGVDRGYQSELGGSRDITISEIDLRSPVAAAEASPPEGTVPFTASLSASGSSTPEGTVITGYAWTLDGEAAGDRPEVEVPIERPGRHLAALSVTNDAGLCGSAEVLVTARGISGDVAPWTAADVGGPAFPGSSRRDGDCFSLCAGGSLIAGTADKIHFVEEETAGDFGLILRIDEMEGAPLGAQLGLMARESPGAGAAMAAVGIYRSSTAASFRFNARTASGRSSTAKTGSKTALPAWVRLERKGDELIGSGSSDGETWTEVGRLTLAGSPPKLLAGVFGIGKDSVTGAFEPLQGRACLVAATPPPVEFIRGDADGGGSLDITDAIFILGALFLGEPAPECLDAADADDSGSVDITDAIYNLGFLFLGGPPPASPFPGCGPDGTDGGPGCTGHGACE